jgi:hypothetical protein
MLQPPQPDLQQGDIIDNLFFPAIGRVAFDFVRMAGNGVGDVLEKVSPADEAPQNVLCLLPVLRRPALIVSQTCDLRPGEYALLAPLFPLLKRVKVKESEKWRVTKLESYLALFPVYSAAGRGIDEDLVADFRLLVPYSLQDEEVWNHLRDHRLASLTHDARSVLQHKLSNFFGRYAAPENWFKPSAVSL